MKKLPTLLLAAILALQVLAFTACEKTADPAHVDPLVTPTPAHVDPLVTPTPDPEPAVSNDSNSIVGAWFAEEYGYAYESFYGEDGEFYSIAGEVMTDEHMVELQIIEGKYLVNGDDVFYYIERGIIYNPDVDLFFVVNNTEEMAATFRVEGDKLIFEDVGEDFVYTLGTPSGRWDYGRVIDLPSFEGRPEWQAEDSLVIGTWGAVYEEIDVTAEFSYNPDGRFYMMMHAYGENEDGEEVLFVKVNEGVYITDGHVLKTIVYRELEMSDGEIYYETSAIEPETMNFLIIDDNLILADGEMYFAKTEPSGIWIFG